MSKDEVRAKIKEEMDRAWPPGRFGLRRQA